MASESEERLEKAFGEMMDVMAEVKYELIKNREERDDLKGFIREITTRNEVVHREIVGEIREVVGGIRDLRAETQANTREILSRLPDAA